MYRQVVTTLLLVIVSTEAAPKIEKDCKKSDTPCITKLSNEIYQYGMKGDAQLNMEALDPMHVKYIAGNLALLDYKVYNSTVLGFSKCVINEAEFTDESELLFKFFCPLLHMTGDYETKGQILELPVEGKGTFKFEAKEYDVVVTMQMKKSLGQDGKEYLSLKNFKIDGASKDGSMYFSNLFDGQKDLSDTFHKFVNDNWVEVSKELQGPIYTAAVKLALKNFNKYFENIPADQIFMK